MSIPESEKILILDFGSQYTQLIARRIREQQVYCEIVPYAIKKEEILKHNPKGIIFSGGPASVYDEKAPIPDKRIFDLDIPLLGICYGLQLIGHFLAGQVDKAVSREYGYADFNVDDNKDLFRDVESPTPVWMSHGDHLTEIPVGFEQLGHTENAAIAAIADRSRHIWGIQFHPEVAHTPQGGVILNNFCRIICGCEGLWTAKAFVEESVARIRKQVKKGKVICGLSGGVDSAVTAALLREAVGDQLIPVFVNNGLLREEEADQVRKTFKSWHLHYVDGTRDFLDALQGVEDPEEKRKIIGRVFIDLFEKEARTSGAIDYLAQGTLYPDVIESMSTCGPSATIKSHHNVGGLPDNMNLKLIEPLRELFKDEVREVGRILGLPEKILMRHPFPGPGLAIRILGPVSEDRLALVRKSDKIFIDELRNSGLYDKVWQALTVLLPVKSVGVMGDERSYENVVVLRAVSSVDGMTADWSRLPEDFLARVSNRIINEINGINRVVYDVSSKPPSTIEWE